MSNINPIKFGVSNSYYKNETGEETNSNTKKEEQISETPQTQVSSNQVLNYMAAQNTDIIPVKSQKTLDVSKYVSEDEEARITEFVDDFEEDYNEVLDTARTEFPDLSEEAAGSLALAYINTAYEV